MSYRLKRNGWHFRLQKWIFNDQHLDRMGNMCPYFWLTNFCIMVAPFVLLWRVFVKVPEVIGTPFYYVIDKLTARLETRYQYSLVTYIDDVTNRQAYYLYLALFDWHHWNDDRGPLPTNCYSHKFYEMGKRNRNRLKDRFFEWKLRHKDDWQEIIREERKDHLAEILIRDTAKANRKNKLYKIAERTKLLVFLPLGVVFIYIAYYIGVLVLLIREHPMDFLYGAILVLAIATVCGFFVWFAHSCENHGLVPRFFKAVFTPIFRSIGSVLVFFGMNIKLLYKNFCPQIDWED